MLHVGISRQIYDICGDFIGIPAASSPTELSRHCFNLTQKKVCCTGKGCFQASSPCFHLNEGTWTSTKQQSHKSSQNLGPKPLQNPPNPSTHSAIKIQGPRRRAALRSAPLLFDGPGDRPPLRGAPLQGRAGGWLRGSGQRGGQAPRPAAGRGGAPWTRTGWDA